MTDLFEKFNTFLPKILLYIIETIFAIGVVLSVAFIIGIITSFGIIPAVIVGIVYLVIYEAINSEII